MPPFRSDQPVYPIGVVARQLGLHEQTLRQYERLGLIQPLRAAGRIRLYSEKDVERLELFHYLAKTCGMNRAGLQLMAGLCRVMPQVEWFLKALWRGGQRAMPGHRLKGSVVTPEPPPVKAAGSPAVRQRTASDARGQGTKP